MTDWLNVGVRFALYLDLTLLLGMPLFSLYNYGNGQRLAKNALRYEPLLMGIAGIGLLLSVYSVFLLAKSLSGVSHLTELNQHILVMVITGTAAGLAGVVRIMTLLLCVLFLIFLKRWQFANSSLTTAFAAIALATLAWGGHGAMDDGMRGYLHLAADILHLLAAGAWVGALAAFLWLLLPSKHDSYKQMLLLSRGLSGFAAIGTTIVIVLAVTGILNYWFILGPTLAGLVSSSYGVLLLTKLGLFVVMLGLAAVNRYNLSPSLERAIARSDYGSAVTSLRKSLIFETGAAVLTLILVAWLGTLNPSGLM